MRIIPIFVLLLCCLCSCRRADEVKVIHVDVDSICTAQMDEDGIVRLEASDSSMLYDICSLEKSREHLLVHSRNYLRVFHDGDGKYERTISSKGDGDDEYLILSHMWTDGDTISIYDCNSLQIRKFGMDGTFLGKTEFLKDGFRPGEHPRRIVPSADGKGFYTINSYTDYTTAHNPKMTYYSPSGDSHPLGGREVTEGAFLKDGVFTDTAQGRILLWDALRDTIFAADTLRIKPLYAIGFGKYSLPSEVQNLKYLDERLEKFKNYPGKVASFIRYLQAVGGNLYFSYITTDGGWSIARYDESTGQTASHQFVNGHLKQGPFFKIIGDTVYIEVTDPASPESNPALYKTHISSLQ